MKIKVFKFEIVNWGTKYVGKSRMELEKEFFTIKDRDKLDDAIRRIDKIEDIENIVNDFIKDKEIIDIKTDVIHTQYHNNGCPNTMHLIYTIIYQY